jgi:hypothetical protein
MEWKHWITFFPPFILNLNLFNYTFCNFSQQRGDFKNSHYGAAAHGVPDHGHLPCSSGGDDITIGLLVEAAGRARVGRHDGDQS